MIRLSEKMPIFVPWFRKNPRYRGERLSFDPSENLENSKYKGEKSESCFSCSSISPLWSRLTYISAGVS